MCNYVYIEEALKVNDTPNIAKNMRKRSNPSDIQMYIDHQLLQCYKAAENDYFDTKYAALFNAADEAREALASSNNSWLCVALFKLGEAVGRMKLPTEHELIKTEYELAKFKFSEASRTIGLEIHNSEKAQLKMIAQSFAEDLWEKDVQNKIRVSEMTDEVYAKTHSVLHKNPIIQYLPEKEAVKDWIRDVAPDYAKKGGRPPKGKK